MQIGERIRHDDGSLEMERSRFLSRQGRKIFRSDVHPVTAGAANRASQDSSSKDLTGTARTISPQRVRPMADTDEKETKLDVAFHATLKQT